MLKNCSLPPSKSVYQDRFKAAISQLANSQLWGEKSQLFASKIRSTPAWIFCFKTLRSPLEALTCKFKC